MAKFEIGTLLATSGVGDKINESQMFYAFIRDCFNRYVRRDWGDTCTEDKQSNDNAVAKGNGRIFASYEYPPEKSRVWFITECDRSATTILFPSEY